MGNLGRSSQAQAEVRNQRVKLQPVLSHVAVPLCVCREPSERLESHLRYMLLYWAGKDRLERPIRAGGPQQGQLMCSNWPQASWEAGVWHDICPPVADNYMTR